MLAWNAEDAGKIIETYKIFEKKPPDMIMEKNETGVEQRVSLNYQNNIKIKKCLSFMFKIFNIKIKYNR